MNKSQVSKYLVALNDTILCLAGPGPGCTMVDTSIDLRSKIRDGKFPEAEFKQYEHDFRKCLKLNSERVFCVQYLDNYDITSDKAADSSVRRAVKHFEDEEQGRMFRHFVKTKKIEVIIPEKSKRR